MNMCAYNPDSFWSSTADIDVATGLCYSQPANIDIDLDMLLPNDINTSCTGNDTAVELPTDCFKMADPNGILNSGSHRVRKRRVCRKCQELQKSLSGLKEGYQLLYEEKSQLELQVTNLQEDLVMHQDEISNQMVLINQLKAKNQELDILSNKDKESLIKENKKLRQVLKDYKNTNDGGRRKRARTTSTLSQDFKTDESQQLERDDSESDVGGSIDSQNDGESFIDVGSPYIDDEMYNPILTLDTATSEDTVPLVVEDTVSLVVEEVVSVVEDALLSVVEDTVLLVVENTTVSSMPLVEDTTVPSMPLIEDTTISSMPLIEDTTVSSMPLIEDTTVSSMPLIEDTTVPSMPLIEDTTVPSMPIVADTTIPSMPLIEDTTVPSMPIVDTTVSSMPLVEDTIVSSMPIVEDTTVPSMPIVDTTVSSMPLVEDTIVSSMPIVADTTVPSMPVEEDNAIDCSVFPEQIPSICVSSSRKRCNVADDDIIAKKQCIDNTFNDQWTILDIELSSGSDEEEEGEISIRQTVSSVEEVERGCGNMENGEIVEDNHLQNELIANNAKSKHYEEEVIIKDIKEPHVDASYDGDISDGELMNDSNIDTSGLKLWPTLSPIATSPLHFPDYINTMISTLSPLPPSPLPFSFMDGSADTTHKPLPPSPLPTSSIDDIDTITTHIELDINAPPLISIPTTSTSKEIISVGYGQPLVHVESPGNASDVKPKADGATGQLIEDNNSPRIDRNQSPSPHKKTVEEPARDVIYCQAQQELPRHMACPCSLPQWLAESMLRIHSMPNQLLDMKKKPVEIHDPSKPIMKKKKQKLFTYVSSSLVHLMNGSLYLSTIIDMFSSTRNVSSVTGVVSGIIKFLNTFYYPQFDFVKKLSWEKCSAVLNHSIDPLDHNYVPPLLTIESQLIALVINIQQSNPHLRQLYKDLATKLREAIFGTHKNIHVICSMSRLYTTLCRLFVDFNQLQFMCCELFVKLCRSSQHIQLISVLVAVATAWPSSLSRRKDKRLIVNNTLDLEGLNCQPLSFILEVALQELAYNLDQQKPVKEDQQDPSKKDKQCHRKRIATASILCKWEKISKPIQDCLASSLINVLKSSTDVLMMTTPTGRPQLCPHGEAILMSLRMLGVVRGWSWIQNDLIGRHVWPLLQLWNKEPNALREVTIATIIKLLGYSGQEGLIALKNPTNHQQLHAISASVQKLQGVLTIRLKECVSGKMTLPIQVATVDSLLSLHQYSSDPVILAAVRQWLGFLKQKNELILIAEYDKLLTTNFKSK